MTAAPGPDRTGLVTLGETMVRLDPERLGPLHQAKSLQVGMGGAESNVAIGVRRLGLPAAWCGRVGADPFGQLIVTTLRGEGVDVSGVVVDATVPTSLMVKERRTGSYVRVHYHRRHGPGSRLQPADLDPGLLARAQVLHLTGITPALSESAAATVRAAARHARELGVTVSLDFNYRSALWSAEAAAAELTQLVKLADIVFASDEEAELLGLTGTPEDQAQAIAEFGPAEVAIKLGHRGAVVWSEGATHRAAAVPVTAVDPVGAGDAFVAGYLTEVMKAGPVEQRLDTAVRCGAFAVTAPGDWEALPTREELTLLDAELGTVTR